jgi:WhiB family transcriptional regulator, redox-sensing transcriptional regulator
VSADLATLPLVSPGWQHRAACAAPGIDPELFFPAAGERDKTTQAKQICSGCAVKAECLADALARPRDQDYGIRGGTTPNERRHLREPSRTPQAGAARAQSSWELAQQVGVAEAARRLGRDVRTLRQRWQRHGLPPLASPRRVPIPDRASAERAFRLAEQVGITPAARQLGVHPNSLYHAWDRYQLGRPDTRTIVARARAEVGRRARADCDHPFKRAARLQVQQAHAQRRQHPAGTPATTARR